MTKEDRPGAAFPVRAIKPAAAALLLLLIGGAAGYAYFSANPQTATEQVARLIAYFRERGLIGQAGVGLALGLLRNNALSTLLAVAIGFVPLLFLPAVIPLVNGAAIGLMAALWRTSGLSLARFFLAGLAPHGIFEIPAMAYAAGIGLLVTLEMTKKLDPERAPRTIPAGRLAVMAVRAWLLVVLPLLAAAAVVEAFVTPKLLGIG